MQWIWLSFFLTVVLQGADKGPSGVPLSDPSCTITEQEIFQEASTCGEEREGSLTRKDLTVVGFSIGESTLEDVARRFPRTSKFRLTRREESPLAICARNRVGNAVVFASGYAGGWKVLDSIYIARSRTFEKQGAKCVAVNWLPDKLATASGISLGLKRNRVVTLLQSPVIRNSTFQVSFSTKPEKAPWVSHKITPREGSGWIAMSGAIGEFQAGKLRWIALYGGVSN